MQGHRKSGRTMAIAASGAAIVVLAAMIGFSGNVASAATNTPPCLTPTPLPTGTITGTASPSPTALPPTATVAQINGRLLGDAPATATGTASPTPLPTCTPTPAPTNAPLTATPIVPATAHASTAPVTSVASVSAATGVPQTVAVSSAPGAPAASPAHVSVQAAPTSASVAPPASASSASSSSSSSSAPPAAAVGLPPPPPPGYAASVGNTPDSVGGASVPSALSVGGTPVVSAVRGNIAPAGAPGIPFPGVPSAARPAVSSGYAVSPTGAAAPIVTPRTGHPRSGSGVPLVFFVGIACMVAGASLRGISRRHGIRA
jgi:hypothetical protein